TGGPGRGFRVVHGHGTAPQTGGPGRGFRVVHGHGTAPQPMVAHAIARPSSYGAMPTPGKFVGGPRVIEGHGGAVKARPPGTQFGGPEPQQVTCIPRNHNPLTFFLFTKFTSCRYVSSLHPGLFLS
ncbi:unnamed protein product, partial [Strongylus vulgaris]